MAYDCVSLGDFPPPCDDAESAPTSAAIGAALVAALPRGPLWRAPEGSLQRGFWDAIGAGLAGLFAEIQRVRVASTVASAPADFLGEWEADLDVPGPCMATSLDVALRRRRLRVARLPGGASAAYFICLAGRYGYAIDIDDDFRPFACNETGCNEAGLGDDENLFVVTAALTSGGERWFACGESGCNEVGLGEYPRAEDLECIITRAKPAHTNVWFRYRLPTADNELVTADDESVTADYEDS